MPVPPPQDNNIGSGDATIGSATYDYIVGTGSNGKPSKQGLVYYQPAFDPRILTTPHWGGVPVQRGRIRTDPQFAPDPIYTNLGLNFLYNPTQLDESFSVDPTAQPADVKSQYDTSKQIGAMGQMNFSLLFDRTYELWDRKYVNTPVGQLGVYTDVRQLYAMVGMIDAQKIFSENIEPIAYPMTGVSCWFFFGNQYGDPPHRNRGPQPVKRGAQNRSLIYYGRIIGLDVTYSSWTESMTPKRAAVSLTVQMMTPSQSHIDFTNPPWSNNNSGGGAASPTKPAPKASPPVYFRGH
jgi:hypothetical protein